MILPSVVGPWVDIGFYRGIVLWPLPDPFCNSCSLGLPEVVTVAHTMNRTTVPIVATIPLLRLFFTLSLSCCSHHWSQSFLLLPVLF